jgi:hypothetical protein
MGSGSVQGAIDVLRETLAKLCHCLVPIVDARDVSCHYTDANNTASDDVDHSFTIRLVPHTDVDNFSKSQDGNAFYLFESAFGVMTAVIKSV